MADDVRMPRIPLAVPSISDREKAYAADAIDSSWISSSGPYVDRFERDFAQLCDTRSAISVVNGTSALHLALLGLGLEPGDEVIVPSLTYVATANAVHYAGAVPVFVDVDPETWCLDPAAVEAAITPRTRGMIAVHLYGHPADMDALNAIAAPRGLWVVEDAAEAHGARYRGRRVGSLGAIGVFSFYGNKVLASGEGGAITVDDQGLEARMRLLRGQGMDPDRRYWFPVIGYNYRLTNVSCALLCAQVERIDELLAARWAIVRGYEARLASVAGIGLQPVAPWAEPTPWLFSITVDASGFGCTRDRLAAELDLAGIETRPFFHPLHELPPYRTDGMPTLPVTDGLARDGMNLPTFVGLTSSELDRICDEIERIHHRVLA